ncbi:hypothetical protein GO755_33615 [Spirosoma sp. HMF4905]|uniref:Uncharacterized protein n=1 Tax=Spirosoma arboris TaxID=2682092 RepID=A0A7K1SMI9_9BACT|nr:hypothetical protein [Spirosoma arboris]MVM35014.1 hypothetical protein [Spirosoma arboris]
MTPAQEVVLKASQQAVYKRMEGFKNGGTIPCEYRHCSCPFRRRISITTFSTIVYPDFKSIELVCLNGVQHFAKLTGSKL